LSQKSYAAKSYIGGFTSNIFGDADTVRLP
jgi:hypothetical protein